MPEYLQNIHTYLIIKEIMRILKRLLSRKKRRFTGDNNDYGADKSIRVSGTLGVPSATWKKLEAPYYINSELHVGSAGGTSLTLLPGTVLKFESVGTMLVGYNGAGTLVAEGTQADSIIFIPTISNCTIRHSGSYWHQLNKCYAHAYEQHF